VSLHVGFETGERFDLTWIEQDKLPYSTRVVGRMQLNTATGTVSVNPSLTLTGIPQAAFDYVLGTRSALEWVVDQFRLEQDDEGRIISDPNRSEDEEYIVQLIERVTHVSLRTVELISQLPKEVGFSAVNANAESVNN